MDITERNSRLVLVAGGVGLSGFLFNMISKVITTSYSSFRINSEIPISVSQLFSSFLLSSFLILLGLAIIYCYFELYSYSNLEDEKKKRYLKQADRFYVYILKFFSASFIFISISSLIYSFVLEFFYLANEIIKWTTIGFLVIFLLLIFFKRSRDVLMELLKKAFISVKNLLKSLFNEAFFTLTMASIMCWLLSFIFTITVGLKSNTDANMDIVFDNKENIVTIQYEDKLTDYFPESFLIVIESEGEVIQEATVKSKDFKSSYVTVLGETTNKKEQEIMINKNNFKYSYEFPLDQIKGLNEGTIYIQFEKDDFIRKETYTIANYFINNKGKNTFDFPKVNLDF